MIALANGLKHLVVVNIARILVMFCKNNADQCKQGSQLPHRLLNTAAKRLESLLTAMRQFPTGVRHKNERVREQATRQVEVA